MALQILHLNASSGGGAFVVAQRLNIALNQLNDVHSEHLVFTGKQGDYHLWADNWLRRQYAFGLHAVEKLDFLRFEKDATVRFAFSHGKTGIRIETESLVKNADIIHLHWINKGFISLRGLEAILRMGKPVVWTCHDMWPFTGGCYYSSDCIAYTTGCGHCPLLSKPDDDKLTPAVFQQKKRIYSDYKNLHFITPSEWLKNIGIEANILGNRSIEVLPNALPREIFNAVGKTFGSSEKHQKVILFAAVNIADKRKGFSEFRLFCESLLRLSNLNFKVRYIGENKGEFIPSGLFEEEFTGFILDQTQMAECYKGADVYVTTSLADNLPTTVMESLACGTPVAAFRSGGIPEMVMHGKTGVLSDSGDVETLALEVIKLLGGEYGNAGEISAGCRDFAMAHYDSKIIAQKHELFYRNILG